ncbi:MAG: M23 family metallopeptidase [Campylobacterota bacterium]|nr:M23 family metallopeptidase [Campylobacterota bacterium]
MKKERLVITVSDINSTKSFSVNKVIKKIIFWTLLSTILAFTIGFFTISKLTNSVNDLSTDRDKLSKENTEYSKEIQTKISQIEELGSQLEEIEEIIGIDKDDTASLIQRVTLAKLTSSQKTYMLQTIPSECPLKECVTTSKFGWRMHPITKKRQYHNGLDLRAARRTPVYTTADGVVRYIQDKNEGALGRIIIVAHNFGFETAYGHLRFVDVKVGDIVTKGQVIGRSGNSGRSNGPHLHYEVRHASKVLDPIDFTKWNMKNYEEIFEKQRRVEWESLVNLISNQNHKLVQQ